MLRNYKPIERGCDFRARSTQYVSPRRYESMGSGDEALDLRS